MFKSFRIGRLFSIPIYVHWSFLLLPLFVIYRSNDQAMVNIVWEIGLVLTLFFCVLLHELGHALSARRYGVNTVDIILSLIGGVARLVRLPEKPWQELVVAVAGPAVNLLIALLISIFLWVTDNFHLPYSSVIDGRNFLQLLVFANLTLVIFNLVPAFPMDGGRMLRALLNMKLTRLRATFIAMLVGQILAIGFVGLGFYTSNYTLIFIAVFIFTSARAEYRGIKNETLLIHHTVADVMKQDFHALEESNQMDDAISTLVNSGQQHFIVLNLVHLEGVLTHQNLLKSISDKNTTAQVSEYMTKDFKVLTPQDDIQIAYQLFEEDGCEIIPVVENGIVVGILDKKSLQTFLELEAAKKT